MANEVRLTAAYSFVSDGLTLNSSNTVNYSISGSNAVGNIQVIGSGVSEPIALSDFTDLRFLYLKNQSETNNVSLSLNSGQSQVFSVLRPSEFLLLPAVTTGVWASGVGAQIDLQVLGNES